MNSKDIIEYLEGLEDTVAVADSIIKQQKQEIASLKFEITNLEAKLNVKDQKKLQPIKELSFEEADLMLAALQKIHFPKTRRIFNENS